MRWPTIVSVSVVLSLGLALFAYAQFTGSQTASGTVTVSSTAGDLYICEPDSTPGPDCGSDDRGADEAIFEALEDIRPGETREWDIRLKNVGTVDWLVTAVVVSIVETADPGADCPDNALQAVIMGPQFPPSVPGVVILGKNDDPVNDNPSGVPGAANFVYMTQGFTVTRNVKVAAGDYEDLRLTLQLPVSQASPTPVFPSPTPGPTPGALEGCAGNEWNVSWVFTVL